MAKLNKLNPDEKAALKAFKSFFKGLISFDCEATEGVTVLRVKTPGSVFSRTSLSWCGRSDKWNKKRGQYEAMRRFQCGNYVIAHNGIGVMI